VQNSVANWLNDAAKTKPQWVQQLTDLWFAESHPATAAKARDYICKRARRNLQ
jgi:3-methyladenine DNA glycosylase AlkC